MIRPCVADDFEMVSSIINEAATAYKGVIPDDCWHEPYMSQSALQSEIEAGVQFWGWDEGERLTGVMGLQSVRDVALIRHAYIGSQHQGKGIGGKLLKALAEKADKRMLVGAWADAKWAIRFYEGQGFRQVSEIEKNELLQTYWTVSKRQIETSVVLVKEN